MAVKKLKEQDSYLISLRQPRSVAAEAFRSARTSLQFAIGDHLIKNLLVTSSTQGEGKTTNAINLAVTLSQSGKRVCLLDADMRRSTLHRVFGLWEKTGLSNLLTQELDPLEVMQESEVEGLGIIPAGPIPPNPAELLSQEKLVRVFARLGERMDLVIVDSPPVLAVTDAVILAGKMDAVVLVAQAGVTRNEALKETYKRLEQAGARVLGAMLNNVNTQDGQYKYSHYYRDSNYRYEREEAET